MHTATLEKVVDLPSITVFSDDDTRPSQCTVMDIHWHPAEGTPGRIRLSGEALQRFLLLMSEVPPATLVRAMFTDQELRQEVLATSGAEELPV